MKDAPIWMVALGAALLLGYNLPRDAYESQAAVEIRANEHACTFQAPPRSAAYPITKHGELRGCLYVDEVNPEKLQVVRRVAM